MKFFIYYVCLAVFFHYVFAFFGLFGLGKDPSPAPTETTVTTETISVSYTVQPNTTVIDVASGPKVLVLSLSLNDGLGDVAFGGNVVSELSLFRPRPQITWLRIYPNAVRLVVGETFLAKEIGLTQGGSPFQSSEDFGLQAIRGNLDATWRHADFVFVAPWIFSTSPQADGGLLSILQRTGREVWIASEYGRGMGHINSYTKGVAHRIPTGWAPEDSLAEGSFTAGVFQSIKRMPLSKTNWSTALATHCGLDGLPAPRIWWAYGRKDSAPVHALELAAADGGRVEVTKLIPVDSEGRMATGRRKTTGEIYNELLQKTAHGQHVDMVKIRVESEIEVRIAGQLSELLVHILSRDRSSDPVTVPEVIVAPNLNLTAVTGLPSVSPVMISRIKLVGPRNETIDVLTPTRPVCITTMHIPRQEMRSFLSQCEKSGALSTGDQSVGESVLMGLRLVGQADAKVEQFEQARRLQREGRVDQVPDLGKSLRRVLRSEEWRERIRRWSKSRGEWAEARFMSNGMFTDADPGVLGAMMRTGSFG